MKTGSILVIDDKLIIDYNQNGKNKKIALPIDDIVKKYTQTNAEKLKREIKLKFRIKIDKK